MADYDDEEASLFDRLVTLVKVGFFIWCWYASGSFWVGIGCWFFLEFCILGARVVSGLSGNLVGVASLLLGLVSFLVMMTIVTYSLQGYLYNLVNILRFFFSSENVLFALPHKLWCYDRNKNKFPISEMVEW